jgi:hypothetical protein
MRARVLLLGGAVVLGASTVVGISGAATQRPAQTVTVNVRVDCLAGRGVAFSLIPWAATLYPGDSIDWALDQTSTVDSMEIVDLKGRGWPFKKKPPYKAKRGKGIGARDLDAAQKAGKYNYGVLAYCNRGAETDTVLIDPDMIIVRGGGS